ncbi:MAG: polyphenol oxidase family protein [Actinomycetota bacterium]
MGKDRYVLASPALERRGVLVAFTERTGGTSLPPHRSLNLGFHTGDDPSRVRQNRELVAADLGTGPFATARQVHGARSAGVGRAHAGAGFSDPGTAIAGADVLVVTRRGIPVAVLVADCVPLLLAGSRGTVVAVHAGWRGLAAGVLDRALAAAGDGLTAAIGPAVGPCHYEVGEEVVAAVDAGTGGRARASRRGRPSLDLPGTVAAVLRDAGVRRVDRAGVCTACEEGRFFSHRRDGRTGRQAMVAMRL